MKGHEVERELTPENMARMPEYAWARRGFHRGAAGLELLRGLMEAEGRKQFLLGTMECRPARGSEGPQGMIHRRGALPHLPGRRTPSYTTKDPQNKDCPVP